MAERREPSPDAGARKPRKDAERRRRLAEGSLWRCPSCGLAGTVFIVTSFLDRCVLDTHPEGQPETVKGTRSVGGRPICPDCGTLMEGQLDRRGREEE